MFFIALAVVCLLFPSLGRLLGLIFLAGFLASLSFAAKVFL